MTTFIKILFIPLVGLMLFLQALEAKMYSETCGEAKCVEKLLMDRYREVPVGMGLRNDGTLIRIFENKITTKWSIVQQTPEGSACIIMYGQGWIETIPILPEASHGDRNE